MFLILQLNYDIMEFRSRSLEGSSMLICIFILGNLELKARHLCFRLFNKTGIGG